MLSTLRSAKAKGFDRSLSLAKRAALVQARRRFVSGRRFIFISHPIDNTGAPLVLIDMVKEFASKYGAGKVQVMAPAVAPEVREQLQKNGVKIDKAAASLGRRLISLQLGLRKNDFVLMNTVAIYENYYRFVISALESGRLRRAYWFIHEDPAQLKAFTNSIFKPGDMVRLKKLIDGGQLIVLVPSKRTKQEYDKFFGVRNVHTIHLRVDIPPQYKRPRPADNYKEINFVLSGIPSDGRKGQLIAISAFYNYLKNFAEKQPRKYRAFKLHLPSMGDDYLSQQIRWIGDSLLGKRVIFYPPLTFKDSLALTDKCNSVICCSLNETFGLTVAEGMFMGHVVLRNNSAGVDEQLKDGVNGYLVDHRDINQFAKAIEKVLNKDTNADEKLQKMGRASQEMIEPYSRNTYLDKIESL